jgi:hypothetical protein
MHALLMVKYLQHRRTGGYCTEGVQVNVAVCVMIDILKVGRSLLADF